MMSLFKTLLGVNPDGSPATEKKTRRQQLKDMRNAFLAVSGVSAGLTLACSFSPATQQMGENIVNTLGVPQEPTDTRHEDEQQLKQFLGTQEPTAHAPGSDNPLDNDNCTYPMNGLPGFLTDQNPEDQTYDIFMAGHTRNVRPVATALKDQVFSVPSGSDLEKLIQAGDQFQVCTR